MPKIILGGNYILLSPFCILLIWSLLCIGYKSSRGQMHIIQAGRAYVGACFMFLVELFWEKLRISLMVWFHLLYKTIFWVGYLQGLELVYQLELEIFTLFIIRPKTKTIEREWRKMGDNIYQVTWPFDHVVKWQT